MRLDRPIGTWLLLLPCWWSLALGWKLNPNLISLWELGYLYLLFTLGAVIMRGAGCIINDLWDRELDRVVARTADRPIAAGVITVNRACVFLVILFLIASLILLELNETCWLLGLLVLILVCSYPGFKRFTYWPQFILGLTFNWGALMGWAAITGEISLESLILYLSGIVWTLGYDTIYAHQDKEDDILVGIKSSALALGTRTKLFLGIFYSLTIFGMLLLGWMNTFGTIFFLLAAVGFGQLSWQAISIDIDNPSDCLKKFRSNRLFGWLITLAIFCG
tara:strand:- start:1124 stop:1957 length:834 start_codon:yes stop_codon:yes gene_type:complete